MMPEPTEIRNVRIVEEPKEDKAISYVLAALVLFLALWFGTSHSKIAAQVCSFVEDCHARQ
jgi:hypothetical protein